eukprot:m.201288 g.201288  ORF g.201288 m.201288 type:complete len:682 (+) comp21371_c0_seq1:95-2140(+)
MSGQRRDLDATRDAAALAWAEQYADILSHDAVFQAALRARRLNQQCINVLLRQREAVDAAMMLNHAQDARLHGPPLTLASSRTNSGSGAAAQTVGGGGSGSSAGATGVAVGTSYWSVAADGSLPEPNVDVATPSFMQRKAQLRRVFVGGGAATWDAAEREDLSARVIDSVRLRLKASVLAKHAPTAQLKEAKLKRLKEISSVPIGADEIDTVGVDWDAVARQLRCTRVQRTAMDCRIQYMHWDHPRVSNLPWSKDEEKKLLTIDSAGREHENASHKTLCPAGERNWEDIARRLGTARTPQQCLCHYQSSLNSLLVKQKWSAEEDRALLAAVEEHGPNDWKRLSLLVPGRTSNQLMQRYRNIYQPRKTGRWSEKEDNVLLDAVKKVRQRHGQDVWIEVAKLVPHRTDRQCRERYVRVLDPTLRKGEWTPEEIDLLTKAHAEFGDNWSKISEHLKANGVNRADPDVQRRVKILKPEAKAAGKQRTKIKAARVGHFSGRNSRPSSTGAAAGSALADEDIAQVFNLINPPRKRRGSGSTSSERGADVRQRVKRQRSERSKRSAVHGAVQDVLKVGGRSTPPAAPQPAQPTPLPPTAATVGALNMLVDVLGHDAVMAAREGASVPAEAQDAEVIHALQQRIYSIFAWPVALAVQSPRTATLESSPSMPQEATQAVSQDATENDNDK